MYVFLLASFTTVLGLGEPQAQHNPVLTVRSSFEDGPPPYFDWQQYGGVSLGLEGELKAQHNPVLTVRSSFKDGPPPNFDWRQYGGVSPVKDQGQYCADCWAFSAVANIESQYWRQGVGVILSEQFLLDCNTIGADCGSGTSVLSTYADIITKLGGVALEQDYGNYTGNKSKCLWEFKHPPHQLMNVAGLERLKPGDEEAMVWALLEHGPLSAGINDVLMVKRDPRHRFDIDDPTTEQCDPGNMNHAVLIVGYSVAQDSKGRWIPYWIIKNSWGVGWGDEGYYYLRLGTNACGIAADVTYATVVL